MQAPAVDLTGRTFDRLTVIRLSHRVGRYRYWLCQCSCEREKRVVTSGLVHGHARSCGCLRSEIARRRAAAKRALPPTARIRLNLAGQRFGRLVAISPVTRTMKSGCVRTDWLCACDCGNKRTIRRCGLTSGKTKSCGCLSPETTATRNTKHGDASRTRRTPEYAVWKGIIKRCENPQCAHFGRYGGRGIRICDRWRESFSDFLADMGRRPTPDHQIDRIDNDGNYEAGNCRWATRAQQCRNRSSNRMLTYKGITLCLSDWAKRIGLTFAGIQDRMSRGLPIERILGPRLRAAPRKKTSKKRQNGRPAKALRADRDARHQQLQFSFSVPAGAG